MYFKRAVRFVGEPKTHLESIASSAVRAAIKVKASVIICFTSTGKAARLSAKYRPTMPILSVVMPRLKTNQLRWSLSAAFENSAEMKEIPPAVKNIVGKKCTFQIKITPYNITHGCEEYTVTHVSECSTPENNESDDDQTGTQKKEQKLA